MAKCIICILEVIQIHHNQSSMADLVRMAEYLFTFPFKCTTVMQTGQCIIISFMFDPETFHHSSCHVFHQANLYPAFHFHFHSYITKTSLRKPDTVNICIT